MIDLRCGDCLEVMKNIPDHSVDCILTDVPYKQEFHGRGMSKDRPNYLRIKDYGSKKDFDYNDFFELSLKKLKKINFFTFCDKETKYDFITFAKQKKYGYHEIAFCKTSPTPFCNNQWLPDIEWGIHIFKNIEVLGNYSTKRSWFTMENFKEKEIDHPTPKKLIIVQKILENISKENDLILDPFMGSGTTGVACKHLNRNFIGIELNEKYFQVAQDRINGELL